MIKAIVKNGVVVPRDPLPVDWQEGTEVEVERVNGNGSIMHTTGESNDELDRWMAEVQASADHMDAEDEIILEKSIREARQQARDLARKEAEKF